MEDPVGLYLVPAAGPAEAATPGCPTTGGKTCVFPFVTRGKRLNSLDFIEMFLETDLFGLQSTNLICSWGECVGVPGLQWQVILRHLPQVHGQVRHLGLLR